ncbi:MAG: hypothetical protein C4323_00460 [Mastigocladus sp. ERB_26_2]
MKSLAKLTFARDWYKQKFQGQIICPFTPDSEISLEQKKYFLHKICTQILIVMFGVWAFLI